MDSMDMDLPGEGGEEGVQKWRRGLHERSDHQNIRPERERKPLCQPPPQCFSRACLGKWSWHSIKNQSPPPQKKKKRKERGIFRTCSQPSGQRPILRAARGQSLQCLSSSASLQLLSVQSPYRDNDVMMTQRMRIMHRHHVQTVAEIQRRGERARPLGRVGEKESE